MPIDPYYHGTNWFVDPQDRQLYRMSGATITDESISLAQLTAGALTTGGLGIIHPDTGRVVQPLLPQFPALLSVTPDGQLLFQRETTQTAVNNPTLSASRYGAQGTFEVLLPSGERRTFNVQPWMSGLGERVIVSDLIPPGSRERFRPLRMFDEAGNPTQPQVPEGYRFATAAETIDRAAVSELLHYQTRMLREMVDQGMVDENGEPITTLYEAAQYVSASMDIAPSLTSVLPVE